MNSIIKIFLVFCYIILLSQSSCKDSTTSSPIGGWQFLGLEGKLVNELKLIDNYLYACAGKDGLYRFNLGNSNIEWEYLGFADSSVERTLESGVTDVIAVNGNLIISYVASYQLNYNGIYRSTNNGVTWEPTDSGMIIIPEYPTTSNVLRLQQHPSLPNNIIAGTTVSLIYKSINGGISWKKIFGTEGASALNFAIRFNLNSTNQIWVGGETGFLAPYLLYSEDENESWSDYIWFPEYFGPYFNDNGVYDIVIDPTNENILYFGMLGVIGKTIDKGKSFQRILGWDDGIYRHWRLGINPINPNEIFATGFYLYRTLDGGNNWEKIKPPFYEIYALAVNWQQRILYISVSSPENGIYKISF